MRNNLIAGIVLYLTLTASPVLSQVEMTSNGRYMPPAFCFGVVVAANLSMSAFAKMNSPFTKTQIELLRQRSIDMSKWEGSYTDWRSDFDNGGEYIMSLNKAHLGKPSLALIMILSDKIKVCIPTFFPN